MKEELAQKARLLVEGMRIEDHALAGVGEDYKEQVHHLFEYDIDLHTSGLCPAELRLPQGTVAQVRLNHDSPFVVIRDGESLILRENGSDVCEIQWLERPEFYKLKTSDGTPMSSVAELVGTDSINICHTNACLTFKNNKQCQFCNLNYTPTQYDEVKIRAKAQEVGEVVGAAFKEGVARHFEITGGILPGRHEMEILLAYLERIRIETGLESLPGCSIMTPPDDLADLELLHKTGLQAVGFNLECFDINWFRAVCPGKEERIGYERYREALRASVEIWGAGGRVFSGLIAGIEPMDTLLEGVKTLAEEGVATIPMVWSPSAGTKLHGHRSPTADWYMEMYEKASAVMIRHMKRRPEDGPLKPVRCVKCQTLCMLQDFIQSRLSVFQPGLVS